MKERNFKVYIAPDETNEIDIWKNELSENQQTRVDNVISHLETQKNMSCQYFDNYTSSENLFEVRFRFHKDRYRIFGCFGPDKKEFTLLIVAEKISGKLHPKNVIKMAEQRCKLVHKDRRYIDDFV